MAISPGGRPADASPLGKKGGPRRLTDYTREVAHALMRRGVPKSHAIAIARSQQAKWAVKSKNPAVRAAAAASTAAGHVLDHNKRGRRHDMSDTLTVPPFAEIQAALIGVGLEQPYRDVLLRAYSDLPDTASATVDLDWSDWNAAHAGQDSAVSAEPDMLSAKTHTKLLAFQKAHGLPATGTLDSQTVAWMNNPANAPAAQAAAAKASSAGKTAAAASTKAQKAAAKVAKAKATADAKTASTAAKTAAAQQQAAAKGQAAAQQQAKANGKNAVAASRSVSMSVPIVASGDGPRMTHQAMMVKAARKELKRRKKRR